MGLRDGLVHTISRTYVVSPIVDDLVAYFSGKGSMKGASILTRLAVHGYDPAQTPSRGYSEEEESQYRAFYWLVEYGKLDKAKIVLVATQEDARKIDQTEIKRSDDILCIVSMLSDGIDRPKDKFTNLVYGPFRQASDKYTYKTYQEKDDTWIKQNGLTAHGAKELLDKFIDALNAMKGLKLYIAIPKMAWDKAWELRSEFYNDQASLPATHWYQLFFDDYMMKFVAYERDNENDNKDLKRIWQDLEVDVQDSKNKIALDNLHDPTKKGVMKGDILKKITYNRQNKTNKSLPELLQIMKPGKETGDRIYKAVNMMIKWDPVDHYISNISNKWEYYSSKYRFPALKDLPVPKDISVMYKKYAALYLSMYNLIKNVKVDENYFVDMNTKLREVHLGKPGGQVHKALSHLKGVEYKYPFAEAANMAQWPPALAGLPRLSDGGTTNVTFDKLKSKPAWPPFGQ
jgi:hypothetical protein